jgi:hypothetical protein
LPSTTAAGPNSTSPAWLSDRSPWVQGPRISCCRLLFAPR